MEMVLNDEDIPEDCFIQHTEEGIDIICSNIGLAGTEVQLVNAMSREFVLKQLLNRVKDRYDTILIDCMQSFCTASCWTGSTFQRKMAGWMLTVMCISSTR